MWNKIVWLVFELIAFTSVPSDTLWLNFNCIFMMLSVIHYKNISIYIYKSYWKAYSYTKCQMVETLCTAWCLVSPFFANTFFIHSGTCRARTQTHTFFFVLLFVNISMLNSICLLWLLLFFRFRTSIHISPINELLLIECNSLYL